MNPVTYDLDTSGGLMEQIQELIAPPESDHPPPRKRRRHEYFKRPGRAVNRDSCDSCREGGDLICCDRCPASFHLTCCDPPLEEEDLPDGEWLCHQCTINPRDNDDTASISSRGSQDETRKSSRRKRGADDRFEISKPIKAPILRLNDRLMKEGKQCLRLVQLQAYKEAQKELEGPSTSTTVPSPQMPELQPMDDIPPQPPVTLPESPEEDPTLPKEEEVPPVNPFEMLIKAAKMENPKQFDIPESLMVFAPLPETAEEDDDAVVVVGGNPFKKLTDDAKMLNPKQFEVPESLMVFAPLPGSTRKKRKEELSKNYRKPHELDNGLIPLPAKLCFTCSKSCRIAPLIQCDYCPLLFHKDCVDPPLTSMPTGRWMCPNHPERSLAKFEAGLHTEKCQLFNDFHGVRLDQDTIKLNFFKKLRSTGPPRKDHVPPVRRKAIAVPNAIKCQYLLPPRRLPHPHEKPCTLNALPQGLKSVGPGCTQEEQEEWLKSVVALQTSISRYLSRKELSKDPNIKQKIITASTLVKKESGAYVSSTTSSAAVSSTPPSTGTLSRTVSPATSLSASLSANAKLPSSAEVAAQNAKSKDEADVEDKDRRVESRVANGPVTVLNGPYRTSSPGGSLPKTDSVVRNTIVVKDMVNNSGPKLKLGDSSQSGMNADVKFVQHGEATNGPTTLNGGIAAKYPHNAIQKGNTTVIHKVVTNTSSTTFNASGTPPRTAAVSGNSISAHPTMKIVSPHSVGGVKTTIGRVSSGTMLSGSTQPHGSGKVVTIPSSVGSGKPNQANAIAAAVPAKISPASLSSSPAIINLNSSLQACIEGTNEVELTKLDDRLVQILAWQRLQQLLPQKTQPPPPINRKPSLQSSSVSPKTPTAPSIQETIVQARAMFCPLTSKGQGQAVPMCYRTLQIGTGYDNDVCLTNYGHCNYVSSKHACIFFDETSKHYELLNYSEHGTTVDNVLYSCDFSEKNVAPPPASSFVKSVRKLAKKRKKEGDPIIKEEKIDVKTETDSNNELCTMSAWPSESRTQCNCKGSSSCLIGGTGAGWEGTALLHHGSYIKMGCLQFVFSITEFVSKPKTEKVIPPSVLRTQLVRSDSPAPV